MELSRREFLQASAAASVARGLRSRRRRGCRARQLRALRAAVRGPVFAPGVAGYDRARLVFNRRFDAIRPPAVVRVRDRDDVHAVVRWADRYDVPLVGAPAATPTTAGRRAGPRSWSTSAGWTASGSDGESRPSGPGVRNFGSTPARAARRGGPVGLVPERRDRRAGDSAAGWGSRAGRSGSRSIAYRARRREGRRGAAARDAATTSSSGRCAEVAAASPAHGVHLRVRRLRRAAFFFVSYPASAPEEVLAVWDDLAPRARRADVDLHAHGHARERIRPVPRLRVRAAAAGAPLARIGGVRFSAGTSELPRAPAPLGGLRGRRLRHPRAARELRRVVGVRRAQARRRAAGARSSRRPTAARRSCSTPTAARSTACRPARPRSCTATSASACRSSPTRRSQPRAGGCAGPGR